MGDEVSDQNKETARTQEPPPRAGSNVSWQTAFRAWSFASKPNASNKGSLPPNSEGKGTGKRGGQPSSQISPKTRTTPVFVSANPADAGLAPYSAEDSFNPDEPRAEIIIRDQIRRCELILKRAMTEEEKDVIRQHFRKAGQNRVPSEHSEEASIQSPSILGDRESSSGGVDPPAIPAYHRILPDLPTLPGFMGSPLGEAGAADLDDASPLDQLRAHFEELEDRIALPRRSSDGQELLTKACADIAFLERHKTVADEKLAALRKDLQTLRAELVELKAGSAPRRPLRLLGGGAHAAGVAIAMAMMVWLVTEAMLHSKRLSDGYGPFINGGFNGLGSVIIFGTWGKFLWFLAAVVYMGVLSVRAALGW